MLRPGTGDGAVRRSPRRPLRWYRPERQRASGMTALAVKCLEMGLGMGIDTVRTASWVRRHDVVIVPGMGVLEATVPLRPWQTPYLMFLLCASGRLFGTKVALVSVGTNVIHQRLTRWLITAAARLAHYRSFRDTISRDAMRQMGARQPRATPSIPMLSSPCRRLTANEASREPSASVSWTTPARTRTASRRTRSVPATSRR